MNIFKSLNLAVAFLLELAMLAAFGYAGFHSKLQTTLRWLLGLGIPLLVIIFWGIYMAPNSGTRLSGGLRLVVGLVLFELAAAALYRSGRTTAALWLAAIAITSTLLAFVWKQ